MPKTPKALKQKKTIHILDTELVAKVTAAFEKRGLVHLSGTWMMKTLITEWLKSQAG